jgi:hypothetical protein
MAELRRRGDFHEHNSPHQTVQNGQPLPIQLTRQRSYVRNVFLRPEVWPGFQPETGLIDEGFKMEFRPLLSVDGRWIDASFKCEVSQVEKLVAVMLDVPTAVAPRQRARMDVPQVAQYRFHERFRWPIDRVLLIGLGMIASPTPTEGRSLVPGLAWPSGNSGSRADVLLMVENTRRTGQPPQVGRTAAPQPGAYPLR